ncbi:DUF2853 family protein [Roseicyclus sp. F158]|uniref:DUF2853 family protein n=1 Tax=Tropicimonas omnivorans TaxID=3075590 RepID=A0ABU3DDJ6_9RHOB|nr:DUF2853 family protein [Roseicyclus sp. F158]MDT0681222.1 DUF2853 family protein [Roseicyclus sp. F158]
MSKLDEKVGKYIDAVKDTCGLEPDVDLLRKVTAACGPVIYQRDAETVASSDPDEMDRVKKNFLMKKLGLSESDKLDEGIEAAIETYGRSERTKYRAVFYYLLTKHFGKDAVYGS